MTKLSMPTVPDALQGADVDTASTQHTVWQDLPAVAQDYLRQLSNVQRASPHTIRRYAHGLTVLCKAVGPNLLTVPAPMLRSALVKQHGAGLAPRSLAALVAAWRGFYTWAVRQNLLQDNPALELKTPKIPKTLPKAFSVDAAQVFLGPSTPQPLPADASLNQQALAARDQAVLELLYACGLRSAELVGLDVTPVQGSLGWVDIASKHVHVTGKGNKQRTVPVNQVAITAVQTWLTLREHCLPTQHTAQKQNAMFLGARGGRIAATELRRITRRQVSKTGFEQAVHPHMLRHSFASHLLQSSQDLRAVQELLGHSSIAATQVYTKLDFQHLAKIYDQAHPRAKRGSRS